MPPTRREQLELDELLSDIYRGIETLPDKTNQVYSTNHYSSHPTNSNNKSSPANLFECSYVKEYELPASSPIVRQHKQDVAALRETTNTSSPANNNNNKQPQRSTLKRQTTTSPEQRQPQSLASFVTSTTPENRRRVRIVDHPDKLAKGTNYSSDEDYADDHNYKPTQHEAQVIKSSKPKPTNVKYVNTNKLIYHQERNPDDEALSETNSYTGGQANGNDSQDEDIDGVTRVEYYHTTWLDKQLGRATKRRSSKELNERQVKEKAMIEELKRSLKNGAITLRQSFKGKRNTNSKGKPSETYDDQMINSGRSRTKESSVFGTGLATIPRNYHQHSSNNRNSPQTKATPRNTQDSEINYYYSKGKQQQQQQGNPGYSKEGSSIASATPKQTTFNSPDTSKFNEFDSRYQPVATSETTTQPQQQQQYPDRQSQLEQVHKPSSYSKTLPHNYQPKKAAEHQLLQSHYRGDKNFNTINSSRPVEAPAAINDMRQYNNNNCGPNNKTYGQVKHTPNNNQIDHQLQQQPMNTISSIPSATEVVRSALSRSGSQVSLNQLNKTINLLPNSPPPYGPSPMTPTHQLRPASPSLSPSPVNYQRQNPDHNRQPTNYNQYTSKTMGHQHQHPHQDSQICLQGTRTTGRAPQTIDRAQQPPQQQQPVYANPHASLMQHKMNQQTSNLGAGRNTNSIREFNELDSLLRSLSPASSVHITPGYNTKPSQPSFGYGFTPAPQQQQQPMNKGTDIYAKVQKPQAGGYYAKANEHQRPGANPPQQQQQPFVGNSMGQPNAPFTIDVTNKKGEDCLQAQELSEFEPPFELLPSMEDYQNISKLNPVKNHYWYKPNMSRDRAISLLKDKPQGTFIVRDSTSFRGAYGLAVKVAKLPKNVPRNPNADPSTELIRHFLIEPTSSGVQLKGYANEPVFGSLPALIYQHSLTELALPCKLLIPRADIEDQRFNQKQKQYYDEFLASKEQAKHSPYDRTSPNGGYRKYPGEVYVHNEHRIIFE